MGNKRIVDYVQDSLRNNPSEYPVEYMLADLNGGNTPTLSTNQTARIAAMRDSFLRETVGMEVK